VLGVDPTTGRGAGRKKTQEEIEKMIKQLIDEKFVEVYSQLKDEIRRNFEKFVDEYKGGVDERRIRAIAKAVAASEALRIIEEELRKRGIDAELVKQMINEIYNKLLNDLTNIIDKRIIHLAQIVEEKTNDIKDILDLINEILRSENEFGEKIEELRNMLSEEALEERFYRMLMKKGIIRQRRRKWTPLIAGLGVLIAIVIGLLVNPIATLVILFIVFAILLRW